MGTDDLNTGDASGIDQPDQGSGDVGGQGSVLTPYQLWRIKYLSILRKTAFYRYGCLVYFLTGVLSFFPWLFIWVPEELALLVILGAAVALLSAEVYVCLFLPSEVLRRAHADPGTKEIFLDNVLTAKAFRDLSRETYWVSVRPLICALIIALGCFFNGAGDQSSEWLWDDQWAQNTFFLITSTWLFVLFSGLGAAILYKKPNTTRLVLILWVAPMLIVSPIAGTYIFLEYARNRAFMQYGQAYPLFAETFPSALRGSFYGLLVPTVIAAIWYVFVLIYLSVKRKPSG